MSSDPPVSPDQPRPTTAPNKGATTKSPESPVLFTRAGALWSALTAGFLILIVLLIFITQNTDSAQFAFLGWRWSLPLGVAILLAAVCGGLITVLVGTARIYQLRRAAKKHGSAHR
ncbi:MAG: DUF1049 domain-containing protein [Mycobacterium sp.]|nr:DUF1049 domain-containing protein [Mycobacterium sp.]